MRAKAVLSGVTLQELMVLGDWKDYGSALIYAHLAPWNCGVSSGRTRTNVAETVAKPGGG
jgi:hypothetical protein